MKTLRPTAELRFGAHGGAECFFRDVDGDGRLEILAYQGPGVFGAAVLRPYPHVKASFPESVSVSAFRLDGTRMWTWGTPNPVDRPYICHSAECCLDCADIDGDGVSEVVLADGDRVVVLDGPTGRQKRIGRLPADNFYILKALGEPTGERDAAVVLKNGESGYGAWRYGEPVVGLNARLEVVWGPKAVIGGGHHILALDVNGDGKKEYLTGYCALDAGGRVLWTVDAVDASAFDADRMHVDYADIARDDAGKLVCAMAGSNRFYGVGRGGKAIFVKDGARVPHAQGAVVGRFRGGRDLQAACYNAADGPMNLYDMSGNERWSVPVERRWPLGMPAGCAGRPFHRNRPIVALRGTRDWIGYADGGWPWAMDGDGRLALEFAPPENSRDVGYELSPDRAGRGDDLGFGFALQSADIDNDGREEALIYNRRFLWVYRLPEAASSG